MGMSLQVPITKAKGGFIVIEDLDTVDERVFAEAVFLGFKVLLNRGASKVTAANIPDEEARKAEAMEIAQKQLELVMSGKIKFSGGKAKKASGAVMVEARRQAKLLIKQAIKDAGLKISHYAAKDITATANDLLASDQGKEIIAEATRVVAERAKTPVAIDIKSVLKESPELVAKAEAKKKPLSAKQAGMVQHRARPEARPGAAH